MIQMRETTTNNNLLRYTFDNFVVGNGNKHAYDICRAVAREPFRCECNPIYIYGGLGNGKTHLLRAIANSISSKNNNVNVLYKSSETFVCEVIEAIRKDYDALAEFRNIFKTLCDDNKQIILSSARPPKALKDLTDGLVSAC